MWFHGLVGPLGGDFFFRKNMYVSWFSWASGGNVWEKHKFHGLVGHPAAFFDIFGVRSVNNFDFDIFGVRSVNNFDFDIFGVKI